MGQDFLPGAREPPLSFLASFPPHRLAAVALLVLGEEESAFWCLVAIVETIMPADYYSKTLTASQVSKAGRGLRSYADKSQKSRNISGLYLSLCTVGQ